MPCDYTIDREQRIVWSRGWGAMTDDEMSDHQQRLIQDPLFHPDFCQVLDFREVTSTTGVTAARLAKLAQRHLFSPTSRRVLVTGDHPVMFGLARLTATHREMAGGKEATHVVKTLEEAMRWLRGNASAEPFGGR